MEKKIRQFRIKISEFDFEKGTMLFSFLIIQSGSMKEVGWNLVPRKPSRRECRNNRNDPGGLISSPSSVRRSVHGSCLE